MRILSPRSRTRLQLTEVAREVAGVRPRLGAFNARFEYAPYEYDRGIYVVDVGGVKGYVNGRENMLLSNYWALLLGLLRNINTEDLADISGYTRSLRTSHDVSSGAAVIAYGSGTVPVEFTQYNLSSPVGTVSPAITVGLMSDRTRLAMSATLPANAYELGVRQDLIDPGGTRCTFQLSRVVGSWAKGTAIVYNIDFLAPWVRGYGDLMYGIHRDANVPMVRIDGEVFTARTSGDVNAESAYLVASSEAVTWSPGLVSIPSPFSLTTYYNDILDKRNVRMTNIIGLISPANDVAVNALALYQSLIDTTGAAHTVCMAVLPLSSPITFYARRNNVVVWRVVAL